MQTIYLDNNATTRPTDEVIDVMSETLAEAWHNPSSVHRPGQAARQRIELARESVSRLIGCRDRELVFTSGASESNNLAIRGSIERQPDRRVFVTSELEHSAVREPAQHLESAGIEVVRLSNDADGLVDADVLNDLLAERGDEIAIVSIQWGNNETGVLQPIEQLGAMCREHGVRFHTDATQCVGKISVDVSSLPVDLLSFSGHKFHGPKGAGGLYIRRGVRLATQIIGGPQERERRGGTENTPGIVGLGVAARQAMEWLPSDGPDRIAAMRDRFEQTILARIDETHINGAGAPRLWSTTNIGFARLEAEAILLLLSERGVCASAGAACSSGSLDPSPVLLAMHIPPEIAHGSLRFSLCRFTTDDEIDQALQIVPAAIERLRSSVSVI